MQFSDSRLRSFADKNDKR